MPASAILIFLSSACAAGLAVSAGLTAKRSVSQWAFCAGMLVFAVEALCAGMSLEAGDPAAVLRWQKRRWLVLSCAPLAWLVFALTYARGNGRQFLSSSIIPLVGAAVAPVWAFLFRDTLLGQIETTTPAGASHLFRLPWSGMVLCAFFLIGSVGVVMNLERTFRASVGTIRWRIKFMLLGVGVIFIARIYSSSQILVFRGLDAALDSLNASAVVIATVLILRSFRRAGHFDLDVYPSRSVLQGSLTLLLAGVYLLIIGVFAKAVTYFGGDSAFAIKALLVLVALVGLALAIQSDRFNQRLRQFVSRHFQRPVHDYRTVWTKFTDATASRLDQVSLARAATAQIAEIFQALSVSLWVINEKKDGLSLAASTSARDADLPGGNRENIPADAIIAHFRPHPEPCDIETETTPWAAALREMHTAQFPNGGRRCCAPLVAGGEVLGVVVLGDRIGGAPLSLQDFEMLKCVANHTAASLMNVMLSQKLLQAKELEAFQSMAAFFVHDLKNAASTLNLMLQNLPVHFDNPEFRADALRGVGKTVANINQLISRLGQLRHELTVELADADLNAVVADALAGLEHSATATLIRETQPVPPVRADGLQLNKVVTNLVLNATEAVATGGRVRVATSREDSWVVLTVDDNGCGMSREFISRSLFRPFQTTKSRGLGIGMFQSKMIVEAHGGRIAVKSEPGKGTTFQVFLRASAAAG